MLNRRELLGTAASGGLAAGLLSSEARADAQPSPDMVDTNVSLFQWPFRRLPLDTTSALVAKLKSLNIKEAWAASFEGLLHRDISSVNARLAKECARYQELIAIGCLNLELPDWEEDLRRCVEVYQMPGLRLFPQYHGFDLNDARFEELLKRAKQRNLFVQICATLEDTRTQHPLVRAPDVDLSPLSKVLQRHPGCRVQILNYRPNSQLATLAKTPGLCFDTARADSTDGVPQLVQRCSLDRVMLGTHAPFLLPEAALIRTRESGRLKDEQLARVCGGNAQRFRKGSGK